MAASRNTWQSIQRLPKTNHDSLQSRLAGILAAFFLYLYSTCIKFSKYIISALTFYLQAVYRNAQTVCTFSKSTDICIHAGYCFSFLMGIHFSITPNSALMIAPNMTRIPIGITQDVTISAATTSMTLPSTTFAF